MEKKKFGTRLVAGAAALCLTAAVAAPSQAGAQTPVEGVGTSKALQSLLSLQIGDVAAPLLDIGVLTDTALSTIDAALEPANAVTRLVPLKLASSALPALNGLTANLPVFEARSGGTTSVKGEALNLSSPGGVAGLPLGLLGGSLIPTDLSAVLDGAGARTGLDSSLANLSLVSGLLKIASVSNKQATAAGLPAANGTRALNIDAISVLDLGSLLKGLGLGLETLPLNVVSGLLSALQLPLALPGGAADLKSAVDGLTATISGILGQVAGNNALLGTVVNTLPGGLGGLLGGLPLTSLIPLGGSSLVPIDALGLPLGTVQGLLGTLQGTLSGLLGGALGTLGNLSLLKLDGATIGASTKAADTLANSAADVTGKLGKLSVLGLDLPGLDLLSVGSTLNAVTAQLGNVLGIIDPSLKDLVKVGVLDKATSVTTANGYNNALAGIDVLSVKITPPALLSNLVGTLTGNGALSALGALTAAGAPTSGLPLLGGGALGLGSLLNLPATVGALTKGLTLKVGSVQSSSQFRVASAPAPAQVAAPVESLPRTGADTRTLGILAAGMAALALGVRRWARRPEETIS